MQQYEGLALYYDAIMGDQHTPAEYVRKLVVKACPGANTLLEIACGTGSYLEYLSEYYSVSGLDTSSAMLALARNKVPEADLYLNDMLDFEFNTSYDCVICMNDSVNHLLKKGEWEKLISNAAGHLAKNGVFVFDLNMRKKLEYLADSPPTVHEFGKNMLITTVSCNTSKKVFNWNLRILENTGDNTFRLVEEDLYERCFPIAKVKKMLSANFKRIKTFDPERKKVTSNSERVYFTAVKR